MKTSLFLQCSFSSSQEELKKMHNSDVTRRLKRGEMIFSPKYFSIYSPFYCFVTPWKIFLYLLALLLFCCGFGFCLGDGLLYGSEILASWELLVVCVESRM